MSCKIGTYGRQLPAAWKVFGLFAFLLVPILASADDGSEFKIKNDKL